jgi:hypothetical protein
LSFVHHKKHVDVVKRVDRLDRNVIRIARADADNEDFPHGSSLIHAHDRQGADSGLTDAGLQR